MDHQGKSRQVDNVDAWVEKRLRRLKPDVLVRHDSWVDGQYNRRRNELETQGALSK